MNEPCVISVLHATRRGKAAQRAREAWMAASAEPALIEWIFAIDEDDEKSALAFSAGDTLVRSKAEGGSVAAWNLAARASSGKILVQMSDDWTPAPRWDETIRARLADKLEGEAVLRINDGYRHDDLICMAILTRPYYERYGYLFHPDYFSVYSDNEFTLQTERDGVIVEARDIVFRHDHPLYTGRLLDKVYQRSNARERLEHGIAVLNRHFPNSTPPQKNFLMPPMKILFWCDSFLPEIGGSEVFVLRLASELVRRGHSCAIVTDQRGAAAGPDFQIVPGVMVHRFALHEGLAGRDLDVLRAIHESLGKVLTEFGPDVIHVHSHLWSTYYYIRQQKARRRPTVLTVHNRFFLNSPDLMGNGLFEDADAITAISSAMFDEILAFDPSLKLRLHLISNALPSPALEAAPLPWPPRLLAFGRLVKEKGFDLAIEAFAPLAASFPGTTLTIAGDGDQRELLLELAQKLGVADRVHFLGWIAPDDISALLNAHSIVLMPVRWQEPFGLVALQAAQMARPVVASRSGAIPEIVQDGVTGRLVEIGDLEGLVANLRFVMENEGRTTAMGHRAQLRAKEHFDFGRLVDGFEKLYRAARAREGNG